MIALAFTTQAGCRFTAQLGAMRIAEEIDAMEAMAIRPIPYLVTTRLLASVVGQRSAVSGVPGDRRICPPGRWWP